MPRPKVKKIVTARPPTRQEPTSDHESAPSAIHATNQAAPSASGDDDLPRSSKTTRNTRAVRAVSTAGAWSTRSRTDRAAQPVAEASSREETRSKGAEITEEDDIPETLVQATQEEVEVPETTPPDSGRRSKRVRNNVENPSRRPSRQVSVEPTQKSQSRIPSSPPAQPVAPASAARVHNTPGYLTNFRRQPRQPSILNMVQQSVGFGASDDEDLTLEGETDLLGETSNVTEALEEKGGAEAEGLYDDDLPVALSSSSGKRKIAELEADGDDVENTSNPATSTHLRNATDLPSDPAHLTQPIEDAPDDDIDDLSPDDSASRKAPRSSPPILDDQQSEGLPSPRAKSRRPRRPGRVMRRRSANRAAVQDNPSSSSAISASPPHSTPPSSPVNTQSQAAKVKATANKRQGAKRDKTITLTTAALQALLPQTRKLKSDRVHDTFDIHSSTPEEVEDEEVDEDEDELSRPRRRAAAPSNRVQKAGALKSPKATRGKAATRPVMAKATKANKTTKARGSAPAAKVLATKVGRSYTRRSQGDKENEGGDAEEQLEDNSEVTVVNERAVAKPTSGELKDARKKFEEIDNWEMEFESADITGGSSPWR